MAEITIDRTAFMDWLKTTNPRRAKNRVFLDCLFAQWLEAVTGEEHNVNGNRYVLKDEA